MVTGRAAGLGKEGNSDLALTLLLKSGGHRAVVIRKDEQIRRKDKKGEQAQEGGVGAQRPPGSPTSPANGSSHPSPAEGRGEGALGGIPLLHPEPSAHPLKMRRSCGSQGEGAGAGI